MAFSTEIPFNETIEIVNYEYERFCFKFRGVHPRVKDAVFCLYPIDVGWINDDFAKDISRARFMFSIKRIL